MLLRRQLEREGVHLLLGAKIVRAGRRRAERVLTIEAGAGTKGERPGPGGGASEFVFDELLVATGRAPNIEGLGLEAAGVQTGKSGVLVDDWLRTANPRIFAAGDICSAYQFTHAADAMARLALRNAFFFGRARASALVIPWATYTDPEIAHVGLTAEAAAAAGGAVKTLTVAMAEVDRAILDGETEGFARIHLDAKSGRLLGATVVARHAGELIGTPTLAISKQLSAAALSAIILPYPTQAEVWRKLGDAFQRQRLTSGVRWLLSRLIAWKR